MLFQKLNTHGQYKINPGSSLFGLFNPLEAPNLDRAIVLPPPSIPTAIKHVIKILQLLQIPPVHFNEEVVQPDDQGEEVIGVVHFCQLVERFEDQVLLAVLGLLLDPQFLGTYADPSLVEENVEVDAGELLHDLLALVCYDDCLFAL